MDQKGALALGALAGAGVALLLRRRAPQALAPAVQTATPPDEDLRRRLDEARAAQADEADFDAAGMGPETIVVDEPSDREPAPANEFEACAGACTRRLERPLTRCAGAPETDA